MLIEIHMIQNHSPANLNRDDLGAPKTCIFGGVTRARISSQCLKRSIRRSPEFAAALESAGCIRTRRLAKVLARVAYSEQFDCTPKQLAELLAEQANGVDSQLEARAEAALELGGIKPKGKKQSKSKAESEESGTDSDDGGGDALSKMLVFLSTATIGRMAKDLANAKDGKALAEKYKAYIAEKPCVPDIALCGRMTEVAKGGLFVDCDFTVEAALSAAHAISTHAVVNEVDYSTAADDIPGQDAGAAIIMEPMYNSACFYKHFCIDWEQLLKNLGEDVDLATTTVRCFLEAAAMATPSGKQHSYAAFNPPDGVLVEIKTGRATPISYANAFADPVPQNAPRGLIGESIACLGQYVKEIADGYGIAAERFWFSPSDRYMLTYVDRNESNDAKKEKPVEGVSGSGNFRTFIKAVMDAVTNGRATGAAS